MIQNLIVGSGFSAYLMYLKLNKKTILISSEQVESFFKDKKRQKKLENKKIFSKKFKSYTKMLVNLTNVKILDFLCEGGSSNVWGGICNDYKINEDLKKKMVLDGVKFVKLNKKYTNNYSDNKNLVQLQDCKGNIFSTKGKFSKVKIAHLEKIEIKKNYANAHLIFNKKIVILKARKIFLGIGLIQLIDLMIKSKFIKKDTKFEINEFKHKISFLSYKKISHDDVCVKFTLIGSIKHWIGYQKKIINFLNFLNFHVNQIFFNKKRKLKFFFNYKQKLLLFNYKSKDLFGSSIHYCNLKINKVKASKYLSRLSNNKIIGISLPFINQKKPGPISNDIINYVANLKI